MATSKASGRKDLIRRARQWKRVLALLEDDSVTLETIYDQNPWLNTEGGGPAEKEEDPAPPTPSKGDSKGDSNPLNKDVLAMLEKETGIGSEDAWWNIWWLISKPEHDNDKKENAFMSDKKDLSLFAYASALSYDWKERGVTTGIVGFTTGCDGSDDGDAIDLFKVYASLGGEDLTPMAKGCTKDKNKCQKLISKIHSLANDDKWILAQWRALFAPRGYLRQTVQTWKKVGVAKPSPLAIATVFDASLNMGWDGKDGGCVNLEKLAVHGDEDATLEKYNAWRAKVAGTNDYNSPPINGKNRAGQYETLRKAKCFSLTGCDVEIKKAIAWEMK